MADDSTDLTGGDGGGDGGALSSNLTSINDKTTKLTTGANTFAKAITSAFAQGVTGAKSFDQVLQSLGQRISALSLNLALKPLTSLLGSGIDKLIGGITGATSNATPFAQGGVIASPNYFPLGGGLGVAGEAGPEAIMPLTRGPDGSLGVAASGAAAQNVTVNIATPDADSFRRSETYLTGLIARAVSRGQRGM